MPISRATECIYIDQTQKNVMHTFYRHAHMQRLDELTHKRALTMRIHSTHIYSEAAADTHACD